MRFGAEWSYTIGRNENGPRNGSELARSVGRYPRSAWVERPRRNSDFPAIIAQGVYIVNTLAPAWPLDLHLIDWPGASYEMTPGSAEHPMHRRSRSTGRPNRLRRTGRAGCRIPRVAFDRIRWAPERSGSAGDGLNSGEARG